MNAELLIPILVPPLQLTDVRSIFHQTRLFTITEHSELDELRQLISEAACLQLKPLDRWESARNEFLLALPGFLKHMYAQNRLFAASQEAVYRPPEKARPPVRDRHILIPRTQPVN